MTTQPSAPSAEALTFIFDRYACGEPMRNQLAKILDAYHRARLAAERELARPVVTVDAPSAATSITEEIINAGIAALGADDDRPSAAVALDVYLAMCRRLPIGEP